jgi:NAD(P)-dependent dehydrogenase (short-subunit alcohol dehydrogenase family)
LLIRLERWFEVISTSGILQKADPARWREHRFGMPADRWARLCGKSFWITGAGTGYGRSMAIALAAAGGRVFITGRRADKLGETLNEVARLAAGTERCQPIVCDLTNPGDVFAACEQVRRSCDSLFGLINNAALPSSGRPQPLQQDSLEEWERMLRTNLTAPWLVTREIFRHMLKGREARVLFVTSEAGWASTPGFGPYNITKSGLNSLSASMASEYAASFPEADVQMNTIDPGEARTEMNQQSSHSPYSVVSMTLALLSHPRGGPNGKFFHRDGRHLGFAYAEPYGKPLLG